MQLHKIHVIALVLAISVGIGGVVGGAGCTRKAKDAAEQPGKAGPAVGDMRISPRPGPGTKTKPGTATTPGTMTPKVDTPANAGNGPKPDKGPTVMAPAADQKTVVDSANQFTLGLYARLQSKKGNLFFSPWSINTAIGMTYAGAKSNTASQMAKVMHYNLAHSKLHPAIGAVQSQLLGAKGYDLAVANRVFPQTGFALSPSYVSVLKKSYGSTLQQLNYKENPEAARKVINLWVKKQTKDRIPKLLDKKDIEKETRMVLVNAIYFKGSWASRFDKKNTKDLDFSVSASKKVKTATMHQQSTFGYRVAPDASVLEMGYVGKRLSMVVVLPKKVDGLAALEKSLTAKRLTELTSNLPQKKVNVYLPRFKLNSHFKLKKQLSAMGMPVAFTVRADFSGMEPDRKLKLSKVIHQANCDVTEEGTVAAAATAVIAKLRGAALPPKVPTFRADHPFLFMIRDQKTGVILFIGRFVAPK